MPITDLLKDDLSHLQLRGTGAHKQAEKENNGLDGEGEAGC